MKPELITRDRIYIATFTRDSLEVAKEYGFGLELNHSCVSMNMDPENWESTLEWIRKDLKEAGAEDHFIIHGPFTELSFDSIDPRAVQLTFDRYDEFLRLAKEIGAKRMILHTGYFPFLYYPEWHLEKSLEYWPEFLNKVPEDMTLLIENVFEEDPIIYRQIVEGLDRPNVRCCMDVGHINAMASKDWPAERWIEYLGPLIGHFHLHNNMGEKDLHSSLTDGTIDPAKVMDAIEKYCPDDITLTIESKTARDTAKWLDQRYNLKKK